MTQQANFSPLFAHGRPTVRPDEAALALGITSQQLRDLEVQGLVQAFAIGDAPMPKREHLRFTRASIEGFHAWRCEHRGTRVLFALSTEAQQWLQHLRTATVAAQKTQLEIA